MDVVSLVLSLAGTLDLCISKGQQIKRFCREIRNLSKDIEEMTLIIDGICAKMEVQVGLLKDLWNSPGILQPSLQTHYALAISRLYEKLLGAVDGLERSHNERLSSTKVSAKVRTLYLTQDLKKVVADLELWQQRFDPSWYLITLLSAPLIDEKLQKQGESASANRLSQIRKTLRDVSHKGQKLDGPIFKSLQMITNHRDQIQSTNTYVSYFDEKQVLLDRTNYGPKANPATTKGHVRDMARMLSHVDPESFGLLKCIGAVEIQPSAPSENVQFEYILEIPKGLEGPRTLRDILLTTPAISLTKRLKLAKQLARSVMFVHTMGFVHKGIRPETVIIFEKQGNGGCIGPSFLIGFERMRYELGQTDNMGDMEWQRNLYRHPNRQGLWSEEAFRMHHDIYSLGVCLLEIALWHSFVSYESDTRLPHPWSELNIDNAIMDRNTQQGGMRTKGELVAISKDRLDRVIGEPYTEIVLACLCCLDQDKGRNVFERSQGGVKDEDGIVVGVRYIENILLKIEELSI
ncbi:hypothetical protein N7530_007101 [Penicillium desertorum]|uniref:Protein kinase domain-containing protein n=1 Tax=Penicillium desertorum TaxID=1303715 RepID=A0A9W9WT01_9EURO|nr:hypothetical protein N7530_007101 [Penicillium desertorum]